MRNVVSDGPRKRERPSALTVRFVETVQPIEGRRQEIPDGLLTGLYLIVSENGVRTWAVRYRAAGKPCKLTLDRFPALGLKEAREAAKAALRAAQEGRNPAGEKQEAKRAAKEEKEPERPDTVENISADYIRKHAKRNTRSWVETERLFRLHIRPRIGAKLVQNLRKRDILDLLDHVAEGAGPVQANRVLAAIKTFLNWCFQRDIVDSNVAAPVKKPTREIARDRVLSDAELRVVWEAAHGLGYPAGPLFHFLILTGQRRDEVRCMTWDEVDLVEALWTIPAARSKNKLQHVVPLSPEALAVLRLLPRFERQPYVFSASGGERPYSNLVKPKAAIDEATSVTGWTIHDLRRTAASGMGDLEVPGETIARVLNHSERAIAGVTSRYNRADQTRMKRAALELWGETVAGMLAR
jgi:integrase